MERYLLLRSNRESGPYTVKDLREKGLLTTDLLWLEGESTSWKHPDEFADLKGLAKERENTPPLKKPNLRVVEKTEQFVPADEALLDSSATNTSAAFQKPAWQTNDTYDPFVEEQEERWWQKPRRKRAWQQGISIGANLFGLATLVIAVMLSAVMVKKAVDSMATEPEEPTADARAIVSETLQEDATQHAALSTPPASQFAVAGAIQDTTGLVTTQAVSKPAAVVAKKDGLKEQKKKAITNTPVVEQNTVAEQVAQNNELEEKLPAAEPEKPVAKPTLQVSANEYKVGLFGGVSKLALTVNNPSSVAAEHVTLEVEYLKPNGKVVGTKMVEVGNVAPGTNKTVDVPDNGRGVSVRYRVLDN